MFVVIGNGGDPTNPSLSEVQRYLLYNHDSVEDASCFHSEACLLDEDLCPDLRFRQRVGSPSVVACLDGPPHLSAPHLDARTLWYIKLQVNNHRLEGGGFKGCQLEIDCRREEARHPGSLCTPLPSRPLCFLNSPPDILGPRSAGPKTSSSGEQTPEGVLGSLFLLATARSYSRSWCGR